MPLFVLGVAAAYRGLLRFLAVTVIVAIASGLAVWVFQSGNSVTIGASGLIFGYFGYVLVRGIFDRNLVDLGVGLLAGAGFYGILQVALPGTPGISWLAHLGGLIGGVLAAWLLRSRASLPMAAVGGRSFGGWTLTGGDPASIQGRGTRAPSAGRPQAGRASAGRASAGKPQAGRPQADPTPGGSQAADDLLRQLKDLGL